jgi:hypothetical protein
VTPRSVVSKSGRDVAKTGDVFEQGRKGIKLWHKINVIVFYVPNILKLVIHLKSSAFSPFRPFARPKGKKGKNHDIFLTTRKSSKTLAALRPYTGTPCLSICRDYFIITSIDVFPVMRIVLRSCARIYVQQHTPRMRKCDTWSEGRHIHQNVPHILRKSNT